MSLPTIGELVKGTTAEFVCYRDGDLWYEIKQTVEDGVRSDSFQFPVPISDTGTGIFPNKLKAITLMRWVRKYLEKKQKGEA